MPYRIEHAPTNRAGCTVKACKDAKLKILKGELRYGAWVETERFQTWVWRHWGCVTPKQLANLAESLDGNYSELDGFDDLDTASQEKVSQAIENGHVADEDLTNRDMLQEDRAEQEAARVQKETEKEAKKLEKAALKEAKSSEKEAKNSSKAGPKTKENKTQAEKSAKRKVKLEATSEEDSEEVEPKKASKQTSRPRVKLEADSEEQANRTTVMKGRTIKDKDGQTNGSSKTQRSNKNVKVEDEEETGLDSQSKASRGKKRKSQADDEEDIKPTTAAKKSKGAKSTGASSKGQTSKLVPQSERAAGTEKADVDRTARASRRAGR